MSEAPAVDAPVDAPPEPGENVTAAEIVRRVEPTAISRATHAAILSDDEIRRVWRTAAALAQSGMWLAESGSKITPEVAFAKILVGRDLGLSATRALMTIDLVRGAIQMRGVLLAGFVRQSPDYHYKTKDHTNDSCTVILLGFPQDEPEEGYVKAQGRYWEVLGEETYTVADAQRQKLVKQGSAWETVPRNMCMWRAMSNAVKFHAPDLLGGVPVYVEGELPPPEPSLTAGTGDGQAQHVDLGPKVEAVLKRATDLEHAGLADRATAEMALMGQPPAVVERWVAEAMATLDAMPEVTDADVVSDDPDDVAGHECVVVVQGRKYRAMCPSCGMLGEWGTKGDAEALGGTHLAETLEAAEMEPAALDAEPVADPVEAANRAAVLREQASALLDEADDARAAGDDEMEKVLREQAAKMSTEANAIASGDQTDLGL